MQFKKIIALAALCLILCACSETESNTVIMKKQPAVPYYFSGFYSNYRHPYGVNDSELITEAVAKQRGSYVIAYFDSNGRLERIEKYVGVGCLFRFEYRYDELGSLIGDVINKCTDIK